MGQIVEALLHPSLTCAPMQPPSLYRRWLTKLNVKVLLYSFLEVRWPTLEAPFLNQLQKKKRKTEKNDVFDLQLTFFSTCKKCSVALNPSHGTLSFPREANIFLMINTCCPIKHFTVDLGWRSTPEMRRFFRRKRSHGKLDELKVFTLIFVENTKQFWSCGVAKCPQSVNHFSLLLCI